MSRTGQYETAQRELFAENAVSVEPAHAQGMQTVEGLEAIVAKGKHFQSIVEEIHGGFVSDPVIAGNFFSVSTWLELTFKGRGRTKMEEVIVYEVKDGKIVKEQFFY